jgi:hypothetical protein
MQSGSDRRILAGDAFVLGEHRIAYDLQASFPPWVAPGQPLILCKSGVTEEVVVDSLSGPFALLEDPLVNGWAAGDVLRPSFFGLLSGKIGTQRPNGDATNFDINLDCYPGGEPPRAEGTAWAGLDGVEIFTPKPDYAGSISVSHLWAVNQVDYGRGRTAQFRPVDRAARDLEADFNALSVSEATAVEQFFDRMKGRRGSFYLPTWERDFVLASSATSGSSNFLAEGTDLATDFGSTDYASISEGVAVCLTDGTVIYRKITDVSASSDNSLVTVDSAWGTALSTANVARISRMNLSRFASDDMVMSWRTPLTAGARLTFHQVRA